MILEERDVLKLVSLLRSTAPVRTGNLRDNGIGGVQLIPQGYQIQIGFPEAVGGLPATDTYAAYTEYRNKTSKGWVKNTIKLWARLIEPELKARYEGGVDYELE